AGRPDRRERANGSAPPVEGCSGGCSHALGLLWRDSAYPGTGRERAQGVGDHEARPYRDTPLGREGLVRDEADRVLRDGRQRAPLDGELEVTAGVSSRSRGYSGVKHHHAVADGLYPLELREVLEEGERQGEGSAASGSVRVVDPH